jgi:hypothetical protein
MNKPKIVINDLLTNEVIEREMNDAEFEQWQLNQVEQAARQAEQDAKVAAKDSALTKLQALGLTEDELRVVLS